MVLRKRNEIEKFVGKKMCLPRIWTGNALKMGKMT